MVVSAGASNSAKILLAIGERRPPAGLANGSDQVGRNYMFHNCKAVASLGKEANDTVFQKTLGINDFYLSGEDRQWPLGNIQMVGKSNAGAMKGEEPKLTKLAPRWSLEDVAEHSVDWWLTTEDLPCPDNRVTLDKDGHIHLAYTVQNDKEAEGLYDELKTLLNHVGHGPAPCAGQEFLHEHEHPRRRRRPPGRDVSIRQRPEHVRARRELQGARGGQPLRSGHELLSEHRRGQPRAHRHGQRAPGRRPPDRAPRMSDSTTEREEPPPPRPRHMSER